MQVKECVSINRNDTSISKSGQLDFAIPPSKIAALSSGEFVGMVADDPTEKIKLKVLNGRKTVEREPDLFLELPTIEKVTHEMIMKNYFTVKLEVEELIEREIEILLNTPN